MRRKDLPKFMLLLAFLALIGEFYFLAVFLIVIALLLS